MANVTTVPLVKPLSWPTIYLVRMVVFLVLCGFLVFILYRQLLAAFFGNPGLNGVIFAVLGVGVLLAIRQVVRLFREVRWVNYASGATPHRLARPPVLLAPVASFVADRDSRARLTVATTSSLLASISARLDENRELVRYLAGLLVFLGLLGTFWGLIDTVNSVGRIIGALKSGGEASAMFEDLKNSLAAPLSGMGISFSASLFGLASSLVLGFLDLQAGQAQARFFNELEDWLAIASGPGAEDGAVGEPAAGQLPGDVAAALNRVAKAVGEGANARDAALAMASLAEGVQALVQHVRSEQQLMRNWMDGQAARDRDLKAALERLGSEKVG